MADFLAENALETENGQLVFVLIDRIAASWPEKIPKEYKRLIANICKQTSVAGLLQVTSNTALEYLESFCNATLDVRSVVYMNQCYNMFLHGETCRDVM